MPLGRRQAHSSSRRDCVGEKQGMWMERQQPPLALLAGGEATGTGQVACVRPDWYFAFRTVAGVLARSLACSHGRFAAAGVCVRTSSAWAFLLRLFPFLSFAIDWKVWAAAAQKEIMLRVPHGWKRFR